VLDSGASVTCSDVAAVCGTGAAFSRPSTLTTCSTLTLPGGPVSSANSTATSTASRPALSTMASTIASS